MSTLIARPFESHVTSEPTPAWSNVLTRKSQAGRLPLATGTWVHRVIQPRSCITLEDNSNPGSLLKPHHDSLVVHYRQVYVRKSKGLGLVLSYKVKYKKFGPNFDIFASIRLLDIFSAVEFGFRSAAHFREHG